MNFLQPLSASAQQARKIYTSIALLNTVSVLLSVGYRVNHWLLVTARWKVAKGVINITHHDTSGVIVCPIVCCLIACF